MAEVGGELVVLTVTGTELEGEALGACATIDLSEVDLVGGGTPIGTGDGEAVLRLLEAATDVEGGAVDDDPRSSRWEGVTALEDARRLADPEDPSRADRLVGDLGDDQEIEFTASSGADGMLEQALFVLPSGELHVTFGTGDQPPEDLRSPTGCWENTLVNGSIDAMVLLHQIRCADLVADATDFLESLPADLVDDVREAGQAITGGCPVP